MAGKERRMAEEAMIRAEVTVLAAADRMRKLGLDRMVVVGAEGVIGILTDRDLICGCVCKRLRPTVARVGDIIQRVDALSAA